MKWTVHGERVIYDSGWVRPTLVDVEVPGMAGFDHARSGGMPDGLCLTAVLYAWPSARSPDPPLA